MAEQQQQYPAGLSMEEMRRLVMEDDLKKAKESAASGDFSALMKMSAETKARVDALASTLDSHIKEAADKKKKSDDEFFLFRWMEQYGPYLGAVSFSVVFLYLIKTRNLFGIFDTTNSCSLDPFGYKKSNLEASKRVAQAIRDLF